MLVVVDHSVADCCWSRRGAQDFYQVDMDPLAVDLIKQLLTADPAARLRAPVRACVRACVRASERACTLNVAPSPRAGWPGCPLACVRVPVASARVEMCAFVAIPVPYRCRRWQTCEHTLSTNACLVARLRLRGAVLFESQRFFGACDDRRYSRTHSFTGCSGKTCGIARFLVRACVRAYDLRVVPD